MKALSILSAVVLVGVTTMVLASPPAYSEPKEEALLILTTSDTRAELAPCG